MELHSRRGGGVGGRRHELNVLGLGCISHSHMHWAACIGTIVFGASGIDQKL